MLVRRIINPYRNANTYILEVDEESVILVDVGGPDPAPLKEWLVLRNKKVISVFITHEHADHCVGVNALFEWMPSKLYCTQPCKENMGSSKQNFSFYVDEIATFQVDLPVEVLRDQQILTLNGLSIIVIETPGHSPGSACYMIGNSLFSGDTLMKDFKTPLTFPHSSKQQYANSIEVLEKYLRPDTVVYPGHGDPFVWNPKANSN